MKYTSWQVNTFYEVTIVIKKLLKKWNDYVPLIESILDYIKSGYMNLFLVIHKPLYNIKHYYCTIACVKYFAQ